MDNRRYIAVLAVALGATAFGFLGIPTRFFRDEFGLQSIDSVIIRLTFASLFLVVMLGIFARDKLRINRKNIPLLLLFAVFKLLSDVTFFYAQGTVKLSLATLLQMTSPYLVMLVSLLLFRDRMTTKKVFAMGMASIGSVFVTGILFEEMNIHFMGALSALASGFFFGMFMIGSKLFFDRGLHPAVSLFYTMLFADLIALPFCNHADLVEAVTDINGLAMALALGVLMTLVPFYLYAWSTQFIEPTLTAMISTLEIVAATIVGLLMFGEDITPMGIIGIVLVVSSVMLMNIKLHSDHMKRFGKYMPKRLDVKDLFKLFHLRKKQVD